MVRIGAVVLAEDENCGGVGFGLPRIGGLRGNRFGASVRHAKKRVLRESHLPYSGFRHLLADLENGPASRPARRNYLTAPPLANE